MTQKLQHHEFTEARAKRVLEAMGYRDPAPALAELPRTPLVDKPLGITWTKDYDCGCSASGGPQIPDYCPSHGSLESLRTFTEAREADPVVEVAGEPV